MTKARDIASAIPAPSTVSSAELGYLDGVTSAVQTQLDAKTAKATLSTTGDIYYASAANTPARLGIGSTGNVLTVASGIPSWAAPAGSSGPAFSAHRATTQQTITTSTHTKIQLNAEDYDTDNTFDSTTNFRFTPNKAGKYQVNATVRIAATTGNVGRHIIRIYKNGSEVSRFFDNVVATTSSHSSGSELFDMNGTTDYLELFTYSAGDTPYIDPISGDSKCTLNAVWIRS